MAAPLSDAFVPPITDLAPAGGPRRWTRVRSLELWIPAGLLILMAGACFVWPAVYPVPKPVGGSILESNLPVLSKGHILGTDPVGNDIMSRILYGGRVSLRVGFATNAVGLVLGGAIGYVLLGYGGVLFAGVVCALLGGALGAAHRQSATSGISSPWRLM